MSDPSPAADRDPVCATCGRPVRRRGDGWVHAGRGIVAACDLDADHPAEPAPAAGTASTG